MPQRIVLCGAGFLGSNIAKAVTTSSSAQVQISSRNPEKTHAALKKVIPNDQLLPPVSLDVTKPSSLLPAFHGADVVVSLVGVLSGSSETFHRIQLEGAENVAKAARDVNAKLIHVSAIGADAESPIPYFKTKGLAEASIMRLCPDAAIIRPSLVFGPDDNFFNRFSTLSKYLPFLPVFDGGRTQYQPVYIGDLAKAVEIITRDDPSSRKSSAGKIIEAGGPEIFTFREMMELVLKYNRRYRPIISLPYQIGLLQGAIMERLPENMFTITTDQVKQLMLDSVVNSSTSANSISLESFLATYSIRLTSVYEILPTYL